MALGDDFWAYNIGLCQASACSSLPRVELAKRMNEEHPTGITSRWVVSRAKKFNTGEPMPCQCPDYPTHKHWLFKC